MPHPAFSMHARVLPLAYGHSRETYPTIHAYSIAATSHAAIPASSRGCSGPCFSRSHCGGANANGWLFRTPAMPPLSRLRLGSRPPAPRLRFEAVCPGQAPVVGLGAPSAAGHYRVRTSSGLSYSMQIKHLGVDRVPQLSR
ncbi:hypothetical protein AB1Y20_014078 [Prymnesium parvum]|uniref:Uncharacterized protein n=1 Tax=Prymnesium parvum TaxID=97485 RepID=A0AB34IF48_PRYPA